MSNGKDPTFFTVIGAYGLEADAEIGTFVSVSMGNETLFRTKSVTGDSPQWNDSHPIPVSGPRSFSIAIHRKSLTGETLLGEIKDIIASSGPTELILPINPLPGGRQIVVNVSIKNSKDMPHSNDNNHCIRLVCLSNFTIKSLSNRHPDLPCSACLSVAIVVDGNSLYETKPLKKEPSESHWDCNGKVILSSGMVYTLQVNKEAASKKSLGFVQLDHDVLGNWQMDSKNENHDHEEPFFLSGLKGLSLKELLRYTRPVSPPSDALPIPICAPIPHEATKIYLSAHEEEMEDSGGAARDPTQAKHVRRKMVQYSNDDPCLEILFTAQVLGHHIYDTLTQDGGSIACMSSGIPCAVLPLGDVLDSHETGVASLSSRQLASGHLRSTPSESEHGDIISRHMTGSLSNEPAEAVGNVALGVQLLEHFELEQNLPDLERIISVFQDTMELLPGGHQDKAFHLWQFGKALHYRFQLLGKLPDINLAIAHLEKSISFFADGHQNKTRCITELGIAFQHRYERLGDITDLQNAISMKEKAVELTPTGHPNKSKYLSSLGISYQKQFERLGEISLLQKAISAQEHAIELTPTDHPNRAGYLSSLGIAYQRQFERQGEISHLEKAISILENAVELTPTGHPNKPAYLNNLGNSYQVQFERLGEIPELEKAISVFENAVELTPTGDHSKAGYLSNLGNSYQSQFERLGEQSSLEKAISAKENAVELTPTGHPNKALYLINLGNSYQIQFQRFGEISDLEKAISVLENGVELTPTGHPNKAAYLINLGGSYQSLYERLGEQSVLEKAISAKEMAVELIPTGHPNKAAYLNNLGNSYQSQFERLGGLTDLEKAISATENAVELTPTGHPNKAIYLSNLGNSYQTQFERLGQISDLEKAISILENAVELTPTGHPNKAGYLINLGNSYQSQFERQGELSVLEKAISAQENAIELTPTGHPSKAGYLSNLGNSYQSLFKRLGEISDLEKAISAKENAVELTPTGHPNKPIYLNNLGHSYHTQFQRLEEIPDLEKAISVLENAVKLTPTGHPNKAAYLINLGNSYQSQFEKLGELSDLEKAISARENAVELTPTGHPSKILHLNNLGISYRSKFEELGEISVLKMAISAQENAVHLTPTAHPGKAMYLHNLGQSYQIQFQRSGEISDLEKATSVLENAVKITPPGHPSKAAYLNSLGNLYQSQFERLGEHFTLKMAINSFFQASQSSPSPPIIRFEGAVSWAKCAEIAGVSPIDAYDTALQLLPHVAWIGLTILHRYTLLSDASNVIHDAALAAISSGHYEMALEWLEQGRSIVWGQLLHLRTPVDDLLVKKPELATELLAVSQALEMASARTAEPESNLSVEQIAKNHHLLASQWDNLIQKVHLVPGFEGFLSSKTVSQLIPAAKFGPVIVITIHKAGCHALVLQSTSDGAIHSPLKGPSVQNHLQTFQHPSDPHTSPTVGHIPLPNFSYEKAKDMQLALKRLCRSRLAREAVFELDSQTPQSTFEEILSDLWALVVLPILDGLALSVPNNSKLHHIWWCPTGPLAFLPIHAAGIYNTEEHGHKLSDFAVSSYTPTITALLNTQLSSPPMTPKILAIGQVSNHGQLPLPNTDREVANLKKHAGQFHVSILRGAQATVNSVVHGMSESTWVHLACHGTQHPSDPTKSAFVLADGNLELSRITKLSLPQAEFAFLSACQTATGEATLQEEAVHLAAGMLMAGYRSVIATMWAIVDEDAPLVAADVYAELLRNGQPDHTRAAYALHHATQNLRRRGAPFRSWVPFIHLGR